MRSATSRAKRHFVRDNDHGRFLVGQIAQNAQNFAGQLRVKGAGWFIKAKDIRFQRQGAGNTHALLLAAGKLVRVMVFPLRKAHLCQKGAGFFFQFRMNSFAVGFILRFFFCQQLPGQGNVLQSRILREKVEVLEHKAEMQALFCALHFHGGWPGQRHPTGFLPSTRITPVSGVSKKFRQRSNVVLPEPEEPMMASASPFFQVERDVLQHMGTAKVFADAGNFQKCHMYVPLTGNS